MRTTGVSVKEAQTLARHATPELTMNVYGRTREAHLAQAVDKVAEALLPQEERVTCVQQPPMRLPDDVRAVVDAWEYLPDVVKKGILSMVQAVKHP